MATLPEAPAGVGDASVESEVTVEIAGAAPAVTLGRDAPFEVHLDNFTGPFDLLLGLISKHQLDITEVALARVTDEFVGWIRARGSEWDLGRASEFLLVAATLLDLKAARLLPAADVEDAEDLALLEARDLLFARLLQYRAYKQMSAVMAHRLATEGRRHPRGVPLDPALAALLPELVMATTPEQLAAIAARALTPRSVPVVGLEHLHAPAVSVREQAVIVVERLRRSGTTTFRTLTADAEETVVVVARFLALLELFREGVVGFDQATALGELTVRWTGDQDGDVQVGDEFDSDDAVQSSDDHAPGGTE